MISARFELRTATRPRHAAVDDAFAGFDLTDPRAYASFLSAHARVVPALETAAGAWARPETGWTPRTALLMKDLEALDHPAPTVEPAPPVGNDGSWWGVLYVLEGSKLGGAVLAARVGADLPTRYLAAGHGPGGWAAFQTALNNAAEQGKKRWMDLAIAAAVSAFDRFEVAARLELDLLRDR